MSRTAETIRIDIMIAGPIEIAKQVCRAYCLEAGLCVTVEPTTYIYTGGEEAGVRVGLMNYPRFPTSLADLEARALHLADGLRNAMCQHSYSVVGPHQTVWSSRREG